MTGMKKEKHPGQQHEQKRDLRSANDRFAVKAQNTMHEQLP
jgi:hypothetical protein